MTVPNSSDPTGWHRPSARLLRLRRLELLGVALPLLIVAVAVPLAVGAQTVATALGLAVLAGSVVTERVLHRRFLAWGYAEREDDLLVHRGVLIQRLSVVPYGRMQFVDVVAGPFERAADLATVHLHTAAAASDARIPGLPTGEAARLRDQLAARGEATAAGL
ncbi:MAG TPA: PH domain-containing protein [Mycobacteriales bacterium]|nr:PH domain-containing protein [Mycobacteriales bacterium]